MESCVRKDSEGMKLSIGLGSREGVTMVEGVQVQRNLKFPRSEDQRFQPRFYTSPLYYHRHRFGTY
jgi:hypothetical protein